MIQIVEKRDGRIVGYNEEKIKAAIRKAMLATERGEDEALIQRISDRIGMNGAEKMTVEQIQDCVEIELMKSSRKDVAKQIHSLSRPKGRLPVRQRHAICFLKSSRPKTTTSRERMPI